MGNGRRDPLGTAIAIERIDKRLLSHIVGNSNAQPRCRPRDRKPIRGDDEADLVYEHRPPTSRIRPEHNPPDFKSVAVAYRGDFSRWADHHPVKGRQSKVIHRIPQSRGESPAYQINDACGDSLSDAIGIELIDKPLLSHSVRESDVQLRIHIRPNDRKTLAASRHTRDEANSPHCCATRISSLSPELNPGNLSGPAATRIGKLRDVDSRHNHVTGLGSNAVAYPTEGQGLGVSATRHRLRCGRIGPDIIARAGDSAVCSSRTD